MDLKYNENDINSIVNYASLLVGKTFYDVINEAYPDRETIRQMIEYYSRSSYKGGLGTLLEEVYFGYKANNEQMPDFKRVGVELKSSPYEIKTDGTLRAGERLSVTMVPHDRPIEIDFYNSDVWHKIEKLLLIYYLREKGLPSKLDFRIDYSYLFSPPDADLKVIIDDFNTIVKKVISGKAHEISESDTLYLGACTKGATAAKSTKAQYYGEHIPARARNFCLKQSYMSYVLNRYIVPNVQTCETIMKDYTYREGETFEDYVMSLLNRYVGKSDYELCKLFGREYNNNKAQWVSLVYRMLGIKSNKAEEFLKANVVVKAIRIEKDGTLKENMSFPTFKYKEIVREKWEDSTIHNYFEETRFLFVVFKSNGTNYVLKGCQFWNMPYLDLETEVRDGWKKVVDTIKAGVEFTIKTQSSGKKIVENNLLKKSEHRIIHVRPHAQKSYYKLSDGTIVGNGKQSDANELPDGRWMPNYCFWINKNYILTQIKDELKG